MTGVVGVDAGNGQVVRGQVLRADGHALDGDLLTVGRGEQVAGVEFDGVGPGVAGLVPERVVIGRFDRGAVRKTDRHHDMDT